MNKTEYEKRLAFGHSLREHLELFQSVIYKHMARHVRIDDTVVKNWAIKMVNGAISDSSPLLMFRGGIRSGLLRSASTIRMIYDCGVIDNLCLEFISCPGYFDDKIERQYDVLQPSVFYLRGDPDDCELHIASKNTRVIHTIAPKSSSFANLPDVRHSALEDAMSYMGR